jgi:ATP-dependent Clp protease, protease subunit
MSTTEPIEYTSPAQSLADAGFMLLMGPIATDSVRPVIEWILHENLVRKKKNKELLLLLCSEGGALEDAFALIDVMRTSKIPIKTVGLGVIASAALMIFIAGAQGRRVLTPNTSILSHQFSAGHTGKAHELFATVKEFELVQQRVLALYQECTGLDERQIREVLLPAQDVYLSAEEAVKHCICDHVADFTP